MDTRRATRTEMTPHEKSSWQSNELRFTVPGDPVPKARARVVTGSNGNTHSYTPDKTVSAEGVIKLFANLAGAKPMEGPLALDVEIYLAIPKSWSHKRSLDAVHGITRPETRPDWDNFGKLVSDALNGVAWRDDGQIVEAHVAKHYAEVPHTEICVRGLQNPTTQKGNG